MSNQGFVALVAVLTSECLISDLADMISVAPLAFHYVSTAETWLAQSNR